MKKILILSYHFPPLNVIASQRALGYANHMKSFGLDPTIITFRRDESMAPVLCSRKDFEVSILTENYENYKVIRLPVLKNNELIQMGKSQGSLKYKRWILKSYISGNLDVDPLVISYGNSERYYLENLCNTSEYDLCLAIFSPHFHLKNAYYLNQKKGMPYVLDYRDFWSNEIIMEDYKPSIQFRIRDYFIKKYWKSYSSKSLFISTIGKPWFEKFREVTGKNEILCIHNGFEKGVNISPNRLKNTLFKIYYTGTMYEWQEYKMLVDGVSLFISELEKDERDLIEVKFVGTKRPGNFEKVLLYIEQKLNLNGVELLGRVPKIETEQMQRNADVLLFPTAPKVKGFYSGKIFEYLNSGAQIISGPDDQITVSELIRKTESGFVYNSKDEMKNLLMKAFSNWKRSEWKTRVGNQIEIEKFSRKSQTKILVDEILKMI